MKQIAVWLAAVWEFMVKGKKPFRGQPDDKKKK